MTQSKIPFDMDAAIQALRDGKSLNGKDGVLTPLIKQLTEAAMQAELEEHLASDEKPNRKNGSSSKTVKSLSGSFELDTPRDRTSTFEPQLVKKNQTQLTDELDRKILALFALGNQLSGYPASYRRAIWCFCLQRNNQRCDRQIVA